MPPYPASDRLQFVYRGGFRCGQTSPSGLPPQGATFAPIIAIVWTNFPFHPSGSYNLAVIIDFHTHIFPPQVIERRVDFLSQDPTFAEMYSNAKAKLASADDLLRSMDEAGVDISVAQGFAWRNEQACVQHNDYLLESAANSRGRIVPFCTVNLVESGAAAEIARCAGAGARGIGELRPDSQGWDLNGERGAILAELAARHGLVLLFHVTEPGGHEYAGKAGLSLGAFFRFAVVHPELTVVGAHFAGGLPTAMSKSRAMPQGLHADTAARRYLYPGAIYSDVSARWGADRLLFGSDFPLISQASQIADVRAHVTDESVQLLILGKNAAHLLGLTDGE